MEQPPEAVAEGVADIVVPAPRAWDRAVAQPWEGPSPQPWERPAGQSWELPAERSWESHAAPAWERPASRAWERPLVVAPVLATLALIGGQLSSFSAPASYFSLALGGIMVGIGLAGGAARRSSASLFGRPPGRSFAAPPGRRWGPAAWWLLPLTWFAAVEAVTFVAGTRRYPTLSRLMDPVLEDELVRSACFLGWLAAFWALVRR